MIIIRFQSIFRYTFFSAVYGNFSRINYAIGQKTILTNFKKNIEIIPCIFSVYYGVKLEINKSKYSKKIVNSMLLSEQRFREENKEGINNFLEANENSNTTYKTCETLSRQC